MRVFDCCTFFNENDLFRLRFEELKSFVDIFIVVESTRTHSGGRKAIFFDWSWLSDVEKDRVVHFIVDDLPLVTNNVMANRWLPEQFQRNSIIRPLMDLSPSDNDVVLVSDVDEIPRLKAVKAAVEALQNFEVVIFEQFLKKYFVNNQSSLSNNNAPWLGTVACKANLIRHILPQGLRLGDPISPRAACISWGYGRDLYPYERRLPDAGWHFSSMGGISAFELKSRSIVEGGRAYDPVTVTHMSRPLHNSKKFREIHEHTITEFIKEHCPDLESVNPQDADLLQSLNLPDSLRHNPRRYERLFFFRDPILE